MNHVSRGIKLNLFKMLSSILQAYVDLHTNFTLKSEFKTIRRCMTILIDYCSFLFTLETQATDNDTDLMTSLFSNYDSGARPVCGDGSAVQVKIGLAVRQIIDLVSGGLYFLLLPYKFYVLGQIGLSKQCRPRSDCF